MIGVYGANGFIGRHVVERLAEGGAMVRAVSRSFDPEFRLKWKDQVEFVDADFRDAIAMSASLVGVDSVIQLVSSSSPGLGNRLLVADIEENVIPHVSFIQSAVATGVQRYVFLSSGGTIYGPKAPVPTSEGAHTNPINSHGMTKLTIEKYLQMFGRVDGLNYTILRVSNPYGPGQTFRKGQGLIPAVLQRHREGKPVQIFGDGSSQRDYIYISDLIDAVEKVVASDALNQQILNIGKGEGRSIMEVLGAIEQTLGETLDKEFRPSRGTDVDRSILDITKARQVLNWSPDTPFAEGIKRMCAR